VRPPRVSEATAALIEWGVLAAIGSVVLLIIL
jgi:Flp pilus assembly pilin Flp